MSGARKARPTIRWMRRFDALSVSAISENVSPSLIRANQTWAFEVLPYSWSIPGFSELHSAPADMVSYMPDDGGVRGGLAKPRRCQLRRDPVQARSNPACSTARSDPRRRQDLRPEQGRFFEPKRERHLHQREPQSLTGLLGRARLAGRLRPGLLSVATTCCRVGSKRVICIDILNEAYSVIKVYFGLRGGECPDSHWPAI